VSVFDRGFLYGSRVLIPMPVPGDVLEREVLETIAAAGNDESYVRVVVTRGSGPLNYDPTTARDPLRVIIVAPLVPLPAKL
jgi:branched-chain amino acid aminotransferase